MNILIITDATTPQVNGVVTTLQNVTYELKNMGHVVHWLDHRLYRVFSLPTYREIDVAWTIWNTGKFIREYINNKRVEAIHIATPEGPIGLSAKIYLDKHNIPYTTSYHTKFPEYVNKRFPFIPTNLVYKFARWVHAGASSTLVTTPSMEKELISRRFDNLVVWTRGVDTELFRPLPERSDILDPELNLLYVGRVSVEKNLEVLMKMADDWTNVTIVGDGPDRKRLEEKYPNVSFVGYKHGEELAKYYAEADVFVFPSKTDTFGLVMLEAAACGTPVAAYPVPGPIDIIEYGVNGCLDDDLKRAIEMAEALCVRDKVRQHTVKNYSWKKCAEIFANNMKPITENNNEFIQKD